MLRQYKSSHGKKLKPVNSRNSNAIVPSDVRCINCHAPAKYLYYNDGIKRSQIRCKVCSSLSQSYSKQRRSKTKLFCPYCNYSLYIWKKVKVYTAYKCGNDNCSFYIKNKNKLNFAERLLQTIKLSQFKLRYHHKEYHFSPEELRTARPANPGFMAISQIRNSLHTLSLVLTLYISAALSARKTAWLVKSMFGLYISHQTVLNYAKMSAYLCDTFNRHFTGTPDLYNATDETYIKIKGKQHFTFLYISIPSLKITSYHIATHRDAQNAIVSMNDVLVKAPPGHKIIFVSDGNPAYQTAVNFFNSQSDSQKQLVLKKVIGLQNLDAESEEFREFKQHIERLNRTYKHHVKPSTGFKSDNGAISITALIVTYYNFLRPHFSLKYNVPVPLDFLNDSMLIQEKWSTIIKKSIELEMAA